MPDDLIDEYEYGTPANANLRELEMSTPNAAPRIPSLLELDMSIPALFRATNQIRCPPVARAAMHAHLRDTIRRSHSPILRTKPISLTRVRARPHHYRTALQTAVPRRDSHAHLDAIRKRPRAPIRITSAASQDHATRSLENVIGRRVSWASRAINCCAMTTRKATPPVSTRVCQPQSEENEVTRSKQSARDTAASALDDDSCAMTAANSVFSRSSRVQLPLLHAKPQRARHTTR